jgi:hypothetical protein
MLLMLIPLFRAEPFHKPGNADPLSGLPGIQI